MGINTDAIGFISRHGFKNNKNLFYFRKLNKNS